VYTEKGQTKKVLFVYHQFATLHPKVILLSPQTRFTSAFFFNFQQARARAVLLKSSFQLLAPLNLISQVRGVNL
jgi:hypothetical protein